MVSEYLELIWFIMFIILVNKGRKKKYSFVITFTKPNIKRIFQILKSSQFILTSWGLTLLNNKYDKWCRPLIKGAPSVAL